jgi:choline-sulfatase
MSPSRSAAVLGAAVLLLVAGSAVAWRLLPGPARQGPHFRQGPAGQAEALPPAEVVLHPERPYNVLLVVVDTLRADHLGAWGYDLSTSPQLDRLASSGLRFTRAISQAPWTTASIGSLLTSKYPTELGFVDERSALPEEALTLAELLRSAGARTGAVVSHSFCSDEYNFDQGFESFDDSNVLGHVGVSSPGVTGLALSFLEEHKDERFFLWVHYFDPHFAYTLHEPFDFAPDSAYAGPVKSEMRFSELNALTLAPPDVEQLHRLYDSEIAFTDAAIGQLLDKLEQLGLTDDTMVVFTADHGEEFLDHGRLGHSKTLYQELVHVPAIVRCPDWAPGVVDTPVGNVDLYPTVLSCLGLPQPEGLAGRPLGPAPPEPRPVFTESGRRNRLAAVISGDLKLIGNRKKGYELYDLGSDPQERVDLSQTREAEYDSLLSELSTWQASVRARAQAGPVVEPGAEERAQLEALGYIEE